METADRIGFSTDEITTSEPTRNARLKWVVIVDASLPAGRQVNAAVCVAAATTIEVSGLLGPAGRDADGTNHPGLPWAGCTILAATAEQLLSIRERAAMAEGMSITDMPAAAQESRVYDDYLDLLSCTALVDSAPLALSLVGPRRDVDRLVRKLGLLP